MERCEKTMQEIRNCVHSAAVAKKTRFRAGLEKAIFGRRQRRFAVGHFFG
jgi:hypothetical protein